MRGHRRDASSTPPRLVDRMAAARQRRSWAERGALLLAAIGIYGVLSQLVSQRTHEIGIRVALGASRRDVLRLVVGRGLVVTVVGLGIGIVGAIAFTRFLAGLLF